MHINDSSFSKAISWSRNGFIAYIPPHATSKFNLQLTYLQNLDGKNWTLEDSQGLLVKPLVECNQAPELTLVEWNNSSTDLAVVDISGNFYVMLAGVKLVETKQTSPSRPATANGLPAPSYELTSYNHMEMIYRDVHEPVPTSSFQYSLQVSSLKWLNVLKPFRISYPPRLQKPDSLKENDKATSFSYAYGINEHPPMGMAHPILTKQACVVLRCNGELTLYHQGEHKVEYHKVSKNLCFKSKNPIIMESSIGFYENSIIVTAYEKNSNKIRTFEVNVEWGFLLESAKRQKVDPQYRTPPNAQDKVKLQIRPLHEMSPFPLCIKSDTLWDDNDDDQMKIDGDKPHRFNSSYELGEITNIKLVSPSFEKGLTLDVLITYNYLREDRSHHSSIYRYNLVASDNFVPKAFMELGLKKNANVKEKKQKLFSLVLRDSISRPGSLDSIETSAMDRLLFLVFKGFRIDVIDRSTFRIINGKSNEARNPNPPSSIRSIFHLGYDFPEIPKESDLSLMAISPNTTSVVYLDIVLESGLTVKYLERPMEEITNPRDIYVTSVCFSYLYAFSNHLNICINDLIAFIGYEILKLKNSLKSSVSENQAVTIIDKFIDSILLESTRAMSFQLDAVAREPVDKLLSNSLLQRLLSLQLLLSSFHSSKKKVSDIAWVVLNIRSASFGIMFLMSSIYRQISKKKPNEETLTDAATRAEFIMSLIGNVKWIIDLMIYFNQELMQLAYFKKNFARSKLNFHNTLTLPILMCKVLRIFLIYVLSSIAKTHEILKELNKYLIEANKMFTPMKEALNRYFAVCSQSPLNVGLFESFLRECDKYVSEEIIKVSKTKEKAFALGAEHKLVFQGEIDRDILHIAEGVVAKHSATLQKDIKISEVYFYDASWIKVGIYSEIKPPDSPLLVIPRLQISKSECIDALRKVVFSLPLNRGYTNSTKIRRCTRCRSYSLINDPVTFEPTSQVGLWTIVFQRTCLCGSSWVNI